MMKKALVLFLVMALALPALSLGISAGSITLVVDNVVVDTDVPPTIVNDRTLVPIRVLAELTGCRVQWFGENESIIIYTPVEDDPYLVMTIGDTDVTVNWYNYDTGDFGGYVTSIDVPPMIINGRTMVPVRFVCEMLDYEVVWIEEEQTVYMYTPWYEYEEPKG